MTKRVKMNGIFIYGHWYNSVKLLPYVGYNLDVEVDEDGDVFVYHNNKIVDTFSPFIMKEKTEEQTNELSDEEKKYEKLISRRMPVSNAKEKIIVELTNRDPALALAYLGLNHPASPVVLRYLADQQLRKMKYYFPLITHDIEKNAHDSWKSIN